MRPLVRRRRRLHEWNLLHSSHLQPVLQHLWPAGLWVWITVPGRHPRGLRRWLRRYVELRPSLSRRVFLQSGRHACNDDLLARLRDLYLLFAVRCPAGTGRAAGGMRHRHQHRAPVALIWRNSLLLLPSEAAEFAPLAQVGASYVSGNRTGTGVPSGPGWDRRGTSARGGGSPR